MIASEQMTSDQPRLPSPCGGYQNSRRLKAQTGAREAIPLGKRTTSIGLANYLSLMHT
jgi:hypothetical protein